jgi:CheY-like chemotaxis protein
MNSKQLNIVLADDDIDDCQFFREALEIMPISTHLTTMHDGAALMDYLTENSERFTNVLFPDINMPHKNGFECLSEIKHYDKLKDPPVVMFSTSHSQDKINILFRTGADVYIRKPGSFSQLIQVIHHALPMAAENIFSNGKLKYILNA